MGAYGTFRYDVGDLMQLPGQPLMRAVTWRGWVLVPQPRGSVQRQAVYRLDDNYWDAYWKEDLRGAFQGPDADYSY